MKIDVSAFFYIQWICYSAEVTYVTHIYLKGSEWILRPKLVPTKYFILHISTCIALNILFSKKTRMWRTKGTKSVICHFGFSETMNVSYSPLRFTTTWMIFFLLLIEDVRITIKIKYYEWLGHAIIVFWFRPEGLSLRGKHLDDLLCFVRLMTAVPLVVDPWIFIVRTMSGDDKYTLD